MIVRLNQKIKAFCGEKRTHNRLIEVNTDTGAIRVWDPLFNTWTRDHAITEGDKAVLRIAAARLVDAG